MSEIFDEASYVKYAENVIFDLQKCFRAKPGLENIPVIEMSAMLEEVCFHQALLENAPVPSGDCLWLKKECIFQYQHRCEKMLRNLDAKERNWKKILEENEKNAKIVLSAIMKDDEGGRRKVENPYRPPKIPKPIAPRVPSADRLKNLGSRGSKASGATKGKGVNKKGKRKVGVSTPADVASSGLLNSTIDWKQMGGSAGTVSSVTAPAPSYLAFHQEPSQSLPLAEPFTMMGGEDDFNLDMFDDEGSHSIHLQNPEAWGQQASQATQQTPLQGQQSGALIEVNEGTDGQTWRNAIAERESSASREQALLQQRGNQHDALKKARDDALLSAAAKRKEGEQTARDKAEREEREKVESQQRRDEARLRERKEREDAQQTMDLDNDMGLLDE
jgi:hypothetical protein